MGAWEGLPIDWLLGRGAGEFSLATLFMAASALVAVEESTFSHAVKVLHDRRQHWGLLETCECGRRVREFDICSSSDHYARTVDHCASSHNSC